MKRTTLFMLMVLLLAACGTGSQQSARPTAASEAAAPAESSSGRPSGMGMGMGPGSGMMARHHATIPDEYARLSNPIPASEASLTRGAELYNQYCVNCHGSGGMGDGPAGQALDPQPAPIAHTSRMLGDDYLYWRISEGGLHEPFTSAMPRWQDVMDEEDRWDVINYVRALASGQVAPQQPAGGANFDPEAEAARHAQMAAQGVAQGLFSQGDADVFLAVHGRLDALMAQGMASQGGSAETMQEAMLAQLVDEGQISAKEAEIFGSVHDQLLAAGLME